MGRIFYSWQSKTQSKCNRYYIQDCIKKAIKKVNDENYTNFYFDEATRDEIGTVSITETIFNKLKSTQVFIADVSIVHTCNEGKYINQNVLLELGFAAGFISWNRVICIFNTDYGEIEDVPFDLKDRRICGYSGSSKEDKQKLISVIAETIVKLYKQNMIIDKRTNRRYSFPGEINKQIEILEDSTPFFENRICDAFPGVRGIKKLLNSEEIKEGLNILLRKPLNSSNDNLIGVFEGMNYYPINKIDFERNVLLIEDGLGNCDEIEIETLYVYHSSSYFRNFIYIVSKQPELNLDYYKTEYAMYKNHHISIEEYYDNSANIEGKIVKLNNEAEKRIKYNKKLGFMICAKYHPINSRMGTNILNEVQINIDNGSFDINALVDKIGALERNINDI